MRILAVDDNEDAVRCLGKLLELEGHEVRLMFDGPSAIAAAQEFLPEVILLDIAMPVVTGLAVAKHVRALPELKDVVLVATTGYGDQKSVERISEAGFDFVLLKPCVIAEVNSTLVRAAAFRAMRTGSDPVPSDAPSQPQ